MKHEHVSGKQTDNCTTEQLKSQVLLLRVKQAQRNSKRDFKKRSHSKVDRSAAIHVQSPKTIQHVPRRLTLLDRARLYYSSLTGRDVSMESSVHKSDLGKL
ncbi:hypothetical protein AVEN_40502-1 [Araneus ventricosus]|uniref:Uncharacterized protein n=1 Tax=Araneus ventricosus TaxID=182803 RepID=A0A4Y2IKR8_ARAVE|nr:hypothetical protein AVEN_40502-1 [Araneus ventricosus]